MTLSSTTLIWRDPAEGDPCGSEGLRNWRSYSRRPDEQFFVPHGDLGQIGLFGRAALGDALRRNTNVFVGWQAEDPATTPAAEVEAAVRRLWPCTTICRERSTGDRWIVSSFGGEPAVFPSSAIERVVVDLAVTTFPLWSPGTTFRPQAVALLHDTTAEQLGLIEPHQPTPDEICSMVASDPEVAAATARLDRATPSTWRELVRARLAAQARSGVPEGDRAPLYSGQVDEHLVPILMRMGRDDEPMFLAHLRQGLGRTYGAELGEVVLRFMLKTCRHDGAAKLLAFSTRKEAA
jgi:hypothetical protein